MAKRKPARASGRARVTKRRGRVKPRAAAKKTAPARRTRKTATRSARRTRKAAPKTAMRRAKIATRRAKTATRRAKPARAKTSAKTASRRAAAARKKPASARTAASTSKKPVRTSVAAPKAPVPVRSAGPARFRPPARTAPGLNRERRRIVDDDLIPTAPSSLGFDRTASAARSGRRELLERYEEHTETSPALTGGDVDADWESAYSVGDEAPGGDNPTPDQDIVDDIGRAIGVQYQDNEELKSETKISDRDRHRWELDPASSDDWEDR